MMLEKKDIRLKLIRTLGLWREEDNKLNHIFFPPLAMGILFSQLKQHGYNVSQDDLSIRAHYDNYGKDTNKRYRLDLFFNEARVWRYAKSGFDDDIEKEIEKILSNTSIEDIDVFLLSIPESLLNPSNILFIVAFSKFLKKRYPAQIVVGGHPVSVMLLVNKYEIAGIIDYIVMEDGEEAIIEVIESIINDNDSKGPNEVKIVKKLSNEIIVPDFSGLPFDKYRLSFLDYKDFLSNEILRDFFASDTLILPFQFIKGCPNRCAFCASSSGGLKSFLSPEEVVNGIKTLQEKFNPTGYLFLNDTVNISKEYIGKICGMIQEQGIKVSWSDCARVDGLDEEIISSMREAGCIRLILGMETASPKLLKRIKKEIDIPALENVLRLATKYGIWTGVEVICGLPHETEDDIIKTKDFLRNNMAYIDRIYCNIFDLRDRSLMRLYPEDYGIKNIRDINLYSTSNKDSFNRCNFVVYGFDEAGGLNWDDKKKQMLDSYDKVILATNTLYTIPNFLEEHALFYLYSRFKEKAVIEKYYFELLKVFNDRRLKTS